MAFPLRTGAYVPSGEERSKGRRSLLIVELPSGSGPGRQFPWCAWDCRPIRHSRAGCAFGPTAARPLLFR